MYINIYIKLFRARRQNRRERWRGGCDIRRAGRWYLVADEGGGLLPDMIPRPLWRDLRPVGHQTGAGEGQRLGGISPQSRRGRWGRQRRDSVAASLAPVYGNFGYRFEK